MCGVIALLLADGNACCVQDLVDGLTLLQHRGQNAAGIATAATKSSWQATKISICKNVGTVSDVFQHKDMSELQGNVGVGHCRYPTAGGGSLLEAQPMYVNYPCGLALAHNGNLTNAECERESLARELRHLNSKSDSEVLLNVFAGELHTSLQELRAKQGVSTDGNLSRTASEEVLVVDQMVPCIFQAVRRTMGRCRGGYAVVVLIHNVGVLGFRDPNGIRPLCIGRRESSTMPGGCDYCIASESVALDVLGVKLLGDVAPGEAVLMLPMVSGKPRDNLGLFREMCHEAPKLTPCLFEYVYFARPDSVLDNVSVYEARSRMGDNLAHKIKRLHGLKHGIDVVMPVPDTSRTSALQCAYSLGCLYRDGFVKNHYIGRTFIMPGQAKRRKSVRMKLNTVRSEFQGRRVLLIDDSIVRGTTLKELIVMALEAGAREVCVGSAAPEVRFPNVYGIDLPTCTELIAHERDCTEIAKVLNAKWVVFQDLSDLESAIRSINPNMEQFENSVFCGKYVTGEISREYLHTLGGSRTS